MAGPHLTFCGPPSPAGIARPLGHRSPQRGDPQTAGCVCVCVWPRCLLSQEMFLRKVFRHGTEAEVVGAFCDGLTPRMNLDFLLDRLIDRAMGEPIRGHLRDKRAQARGGVADGGPAAAGGLRGHPRGARGRRAVQRGQMGRGATGPQHRQIDGACGRTLVGVMLNYMVDGRLAPAPLGQAPLIDAGPDVVFRMRVPMVLFLKLCTKHGFCDEVEYLLRRPAVATSVHLRAAIQRTLAAPAQLPEPETVAVAAFSACLWSCNMELALRLLAGQALPEWYLGLLAQQPRVVAWMEWRCGMDGLDPAALQPLRERARTAAGAAQTAALSAEEIKEREAQRVALTFARARKLGKKDFRGRRRPYHRGKGPWPDGAELRWQSVEMLKHVLWKKGYGNAHTVSGQWAVGDVAALLGEAQVVLNADQVLVAACAQAPREEVEAALSRLGGATDCTVPSFLCGLVTPLQQRWTPLMVAAAAASTGAVAVLLEHGAGVNVTTPDLHMTPLMLASTNKGAAPVVRALLDAGADATRRTQGEQTALHLAVEHRAHAVVAVLLELQGPTIVDLCNSIGQTPLSLAAHLGDAEAARLLVGAAPDLDHRTKLGFTPLMLAAITKSQDVVEVLLGAGCAAALSTGKGTTALHFAAATGSAASVGALVRGGCDANAVGEHGPVVSYAVQNNAAVCRELCGLLPGYDVDLRPAGWGGRTALLHWCSFGTEGVQKVSRFPPFASHSPPPSP